MKKKKLSSFSDLGGMVYSTNPDYQPEEELEEVESINPSDQTIYVRTDKRHRKGKIVTLVEGLKEPEAQLNKLAKELKSLCGAGGSVKDETILVQGDFKKRIAESLEKRGYNVKISG